MTQCARTRIQRLKDEEAALSYRFARHLAESQEEDSLGLRNGENRQPCHDPGGGGEGRGEKRRSCVAGARAPSIEMNHR